MADHHVYLAARAQSFAKFLKMLSMAHQRREGHRQSMKFKCPECGNDQYVLLVSFMSHMKKQHSRQMDSRFELGQKLNEMIDGGSRDEFIEKILKMN